MHTTYLLIWIPMNLLCPQAFLSLPATTSLSPPPDDAHCQVCQSPLDEQYMWWNKAGVFSVHLVEEDSCNRYRFDLYRPWPLFKVVVEHNSLACLVAVIYVCVVSIYITHGCWISASIRFEPAGACRNRALGSYFAIAALHATSVHAFRRCTLQAWTHSHVAR